MQHFQTDIGIRDSAPAVSSGGVRLRRLRSDDRQRMTGHLLALSPEDRRMRFCGAIKDERIARYVQGLDFARAVIIGAFADSQLCGIAELIPVPGEPGRAELGVSVHPPWRNAGVGTRLLQRALNLARNRFIAEVHLIFLPDNHSMRRLAQKFGASLKGQRCEIEGWIRPDWPSGASMLEELHANSEAFILAAFRVGGDG